MCSSDLITIDAEAQNETVVEAVGTADAAVEHVAEQFSEATVDENIDDAPAAQIVEPAKVETAQARRGTGALTGGLVGAVLALAGAYGLQSSGLLPIQTNATSAVSDRVSALEAAIASGTSNEGEKLAALSEEMSTLKDSVAALSQAAGNTSVADRVTALEQSASLATPATNGAEMTALASRLATLESKVGEADESAFNEALTTIKNALATEISGLKSDVSALKTQITEQASEPGLAAAVAATALRAAVDRGGAFAAELENLAAVQPDAPAIAALRSFAASGVPTRQVLTSEFEDAAQAMMAASEPLDPNATMFTKLMDSAKGLVKVRPVGTLEGNSAAARIARIGEALGKGDDAAVASEFAALPAPSRSAGAAFMERFNSRAEADRLIEEAVRAASVKAGG